MNPLVCFDLKGWWDYHPSLAIQSSTDRGRHRPNPFYHHDDRVEVVRLKNSKLVKKWLKPQSPNTASAVEATNSYLMDLAELAYSLGSRFMSSIT